MDLTDRSLEAFYQTAPRISDQPHVVRYLSSFLLEAGHLRSATHPNLLRRNREPCRTGVRGVLNSVLVRYGGQYGFVTTLFMAVMYRITARSVHGTVHSTHRMRGQYSTESRTGLRFPAFCSRSAKRRQKHEYLRCKAVSMNEGFRHGMDYDTGLMDAATRMASARLDETEYAVLTLILLVSSGKRTQKTVHGEARTSKRYLSEHVPLPMFFQSENTSSKVTVSRLPLSWTEFSAS